MEEQFGEYGVSQEKPNSVAVNRGLSTWFIDRLRQAEIDNFYRDTAVILQTHQDVARFDVPVNEVLFVYRRQTGDYLRHNFQRLHFDPPRATLKSLSLHELYRIKVTASGSAQGKTEATV